jgi:predicted membrane protein
MNYLRRLQAEQRVLFWVLVALGLFLGFRLVLSVVSLLLGPFGLPPWMPIVVVVSGLALIARRQHRSR